jgi:hypothetical protein
MLATYLSAYFYGSVAQELLFAEKLDRKTMSNGRAIAATPENTGEAHGIREKERRRACWGSPTRSARTQLKCLRR